MFCSNNSRLAAAQFTRHCITAAAVADVVVVGLLNCLGEPEGPAPLKGLLLLLIVVV